MDANRRDFLKNQAATAAASAAGLPVVMMTNAEAAPATAAASSRKRVVASEHRIPTRQRMPAKPRPHAVGMKLASATPTSPETTHEVQFTSPLPAR